MRSWKMGSVFGIGLYLHWSFILLPLWVLLSQSSSDGLGSGVFLAVLVLAMFGCVVLHELGHALAARFYGIRTRDITLYPIGGVARLERMSDKPGEEVVIAVAGPAVNVVIAVGLAMLLCLGWLVDTAFLNSLEGQFLFMLLGMNIVMVLFNMIPAFPMDGGRVLRALLSMRVGKLRATRVAAWVTTMIALVGGVFGVIRLQNPWIAIIAVFIYIAAQQELYAVEMLARSRFGPEAPPRPEPIVVEAEPWPAFTMRPNVTVYVWDNQTGAWIKQGSMS